MKYKTFVRLTCLGIFVIVLVAGYSAKGALSRASVVSVTLVALTPAAPASPAQLTVGQLQVKIEQWLAAHPDRNGKTMLVNIMPTEPFRATVIRFPEADAVKWTNNPNDWSQVRLDLDRDGVDDEKWLLKNGHTYKREVLDRDGRTISSQHLSN